MIERILSPDILYILIPGVLLLTVVVILMRQWRVASLMMGVFCALIIFCIVNGLLS
jgi:hypothetical protein